MKKLTGLKVSSYTLGCKLNYAETSSLMLQLEAEGAERVHAGEKADICLINTCSVTEVANHKCRQQISKMTRLNPNALVVVTGCYAQLSPKQVASLKGVDIVLGNHEKKDIVEEIVRHTDLLPKQRDASCHEYHTTSGTNRTTSWTVACTLRHTFRRHHMHCHTDTALRHAALHRDTHFPAGGRLLLKVGVR